MIAPTLAVAPTSNWFWYFGRATGLIALVLLTATIVLGVLGPLRISTSVWPRFAIRTLHRDLALLSVLVIVLHVVAIVLDTDARVPLTRAVLPFGSPYRPFWMALGAVAFDLLIAIVLTSLMRRRVGERVWRGTHWLTYASWPVAVGHGLGTGSDSTRVWALVITLSSCAVVALAALVRARRALLPRARVRPPGEMAAESS